MKFVIDRSKWLHPVAQNVLGQSMLNHQATGLQCCLGQIAEQCGVNPAGMRNIGRPENLDEYERDLLPETFWSGEGYRPRPELQDIMDTNDGREKFTSSFANQRRDSLTLAEREEELARLFSKLDIEVEFVGDPAIAIQRALDYVSKKDDTRRVA